MWQQMRLERDGQIMKSSECHINEGVYTLFCRQNKGKLLQVLFFIEAKFTYIKLTI